MLNKTLSIRKKLLIYSVSMVLFVSISLTFFYSIFTLKTLKENVQEKNEIILKKLERIITPHCIRHDYMMIVDIIDYEVKTSDIKFIWLLNKRKEIVVSNDEKQTAKTISKRFINSEKFKIHSIGKKGYIAIFSDYSIADKILQKVLWGIVIFLSIFLLVMFYFVSRLTNRITKPIKKLVKASLKIGEGNFDINLPNSSVEEIQILNNSIVGSAKKLKQAKEDFLNSQKEVINSEKRNQALFHLMPDMIFRIQLNGNILDYKGSEEKLLVSKEKIIGSNLYESPLPDDVKKKCRFFYQKAIETEQMQTFEYQLKIPSGEEIFESRVVKSGDNEIIAIIRNISTERKFQDMMVQNEKMLSVGGMAAGMAHEINNPLGIILQSVQNLNRRFDKKLAGNIQTAKETGLKFEKLESYLEKKKIYDYLKFIKEAGERAAKIVKNMLQFTRMTELEKKEVKSVNEILNRSLEMVSNDFSLINKYDFKRVKIITNLDEKLPSILCYATELEQVFLNLLKNAAQAMNQAKIKEPQIIVKTEQSPNFINISIKDNGPGMKAEVREKVFDPFFTTKKAGHGTGLGLSVSYFIVTEHHKGQMMVESIPGKETAFIIKLPMQEL